MRTGDTILAIATAPSPPGLATHALIRLSGPDAFAALGSITHLPDPPTRCSLTARLALEVCTIPSTLFLFPGPQSFTGEDSAELLLVHNPHLLDRVVQKLLKTTGVRAAEAGEFSARAYLGGKLSLDQAQGIAALIAARSDAEWVAASDLAQGTAGHRHTQWADTIAHLLALTEAGIDFTDQEDVVAIAPDVLAQRIEHLLSEFATIAPGRLVRTDAIRVALVGPPNAGKSTLFNSLLGRRRAITSDQAGTTRDAIIEPFDLRPLTDASIELIDLPGLDASPVSELDARARRNAQSVADAADLILRCDPQGRGTPDDRSILIHTQADRSLHCDPEPGILRICALDGRGLPKLREAIATRVESLTTTGASATTAITPRHAHALRLAAAHLQNALYSIDPDAPRLDHADLIAGELRLALDALAPLVGRIEPDEILGRIFASFCIGK